MADYFLYHNLEEGRANKPCLYFEDQTYTYNDTARMANRAGRLLQELGARIEERILIALPDCPEFVWTWFGASRAGMVITMVNPLLPAADYVYYLDYTRARVAVIHESLVETFAPIAREARYLQHVLVTGKNFTAHDDKRFQSFERATASMPDALAPADTHRDDMAIWLFTSGSTGHPKAAVHLHHDLPFNTEVYAKRTLGLRDTDVTLAVPKLFFGYATGTNLLFPFAVGGATALFSERSTVEKLFEMIERHRPTVLTNVPTMIGAMLNAEDAGKRDLSSLRFSLSAGEALPVELYERWMRTFGVEILDGIGSAEMFHIYITNRLGEVRPGSLGRVVEGYEAHVVDAEGRDVADGEMGTLRVRGDSAALCYWKRHDASKAAFSADWCMTGDQFHRDAEGYFYYHGRTDDMLKVSGIYVAPAEIENCLLAHEAVLECAVVGHRGSDNLIKPKAFIVLRETHAPSEELAQTIKDFAKRELALYKYPRLVEFVRSLPKNDRGKIDRKQLKNRETGVRS